MYLILHNSIQPRSSSEANYSSASHEFPFIFLNPTIHYHVHNNPLFFPILSHMIPIHVTKSSLFKIYFYIFPLSTQRSSKQYNSFTCSHHKPLCISLLSHARNLTHPSYPPWYEHCNDAGTQRQIMTFLMTEYSPTLFFFPPPNFKVFYYHTVFRHFRLYSRFSVRDKFRTHTKPINIILIYFRLVFMNVEKRHKVLNQTVANTPPI